MEKSLQHRQWAQPFRLLSTNSRNHLVNGRTAAAPQSYSDSTTETLRARTPPRAEHGNKAGTPRASLQDQRLEFLDRMTCNRGLTASRRRAVAGHTPERHSFFRKKQSGRNSINPQWARWSVEKSQLTRGRLHNSIEWKTTWSLS